MMLAAKVRLKPSPEQSELLYKTVGCARYAYNWAKATSDKYYQDNKETISEGVLRKLFTQHKKEVLWLNEVPSHATAHAITDYCSARSNFFKGLARAPRFKKKLEFRDSFFNDTAKFEIEETRVRLSVIGWIDLCEYGRLPNYKYKTWTKPPEVIGTKISNPRITFDGEYWYVSVAFDVEQPDFELVEGKRIGIDLGLKDFAITCSKEDDDYTYVKYPSKKEAFKKWSKKKKRLDRKISKKNKNKGETRKSNNYIKLLKRRRRLSRKMTNIQKDYIFQIVSTLVKSKPEMIIIEDLKVKNLMKNRYLAKWVSFNMFYEFKRVLAYNCEFFKISLTIADTFYPSTQTCSSCGYRKEGDDKLKLSERTYTCPSCGMKKDRDFNAAENLCNYYAA